MSFLLPHQTLIFPSRHFLDIISCEVFLKSSIEIVTVGNGILGGGGNLCKCVSICVFLNNGGLFLTAAFSNYKLD